MPSVPLASDASHRALRVLGLASLALIFPTETVPFATGALAQSPATMPGVLLLVASQLLSVLALLVRHHRTWHEYLLLAMMLGGLVQVVANAGQFPAVELMVPGYWLVPVLVVSLRSPDRGHHARFVALAALATMGVQHVITREAEWIHWADQLWIVQPALETWMFGDAVTLVARQVDRSRAAELAARADLREQRVQASARREAARVLHDHVLHALIALSRATDGPSGERAVAQCREASDALRTQAAGIDEGERVDVADLIAGDPELAASGARLLGGARLPEGVAQALAAATHQALANVVRHADAREVDVVVEERRQGVVVRITDDGRGFDPSRRPVDRLGVGGSIIQRLDDVGGCADITSAPGRGTTVELHWPRPVADAGPVGWTAAPGRHARRMLTRTAWPGIATATAMTLLCAPQVMHPVVVAAVALVALALAATAAAALAHRSLSLAEMLVLLTVANLAWFVNLWAVPVDPDLDYVLWMGWGISALVHLVVLSSSLSVGLTVGVGWLLVQALSLRVRYGSWLVVWDHSFLLTTGPGDVLLTLLVLAVVQRSAQLEAEAAQRASARQLASAQLRASAHLDQFWSRRVVTEALPLLDAVARGALQPGRETADRARALEMVLRDELVLGPQNARLVAALADVRRHGWQVTALLSPEDGPESLEAAQALLPTLGRPACAGQQVTVSAGPQGATAVVLGDDEVQRARWSHLLGPLDGRLDADEGFSRLVVPVRTRAGAGTALADAALAS